MSLSGCGKKDKDNKDSSKAESKTTTTAPVTTTAESESAEETEHTEGTYSDGTFDCKYYSVTVDEEKWEFSEDTDGMDCLFTYCAKPDNAEYSATSLNIVSYSEEVLGVTVEEYAQQIADTYKDMAGYDVSVREDTELDGVKGIGITMTFPIGGDKKMTVDQIVVNNNGYIVAVSYGAVDSIYDKLQKQFDKIVSSVKLK